MPAPILWRPDASGGWFVINYTNGTISHRMRCHFDHVTGLDATLTYTTPSGTEHTALDTYNNLVGFLRPFYSAAWSFSLQSVYLSAGPDPNFPGENQFQQIFGVAMPATVVGSSGGTDVPADLPLQQSFNFHTLLGGRARIVLLSATGAGYAVPQNVTGDPAGDIVAKLVAYATSLNTGMRGHDGGKLAGTAKRTFAINRRIRRRLGQA